MCVGVVVGENGANAAVSGGSTRKHLEHKANAGRTCVHPGDILDGREEKHEDDAHAKDLDAAAGHVEHECLHGEGFGGGDGEVPCALFFEGCVGGGGGGGGRWCCSRWRSRLWGWILA